MKEFLARSLLELNDCGCCEGIAAQTPIEVYNRPGLSALAYRAGVYEQFKNSMLAQLSNAELSALRNFTTREEDDFAIALLDAWATVADVLTFYQERIANESYLRTATERLSLLQLARLIGYELRPGAAASTYLAFTLDNAPGSPPQATIDVGTKVQSVPGLGEQAQMFETVETKIEARVEWNAIHPRLTQPQTANSILKSIVVQGTAVNVKPGDKLLIVRNDSDRTVKTAIRVEPDLTTRTTRIDLISGVPPKPPAYNDSATFPAGIAPTTSVPLTKSRVKSLIVGKSWSEKDLLALATAQNWSINALVENVTEQLANPPLPDRVFVFRLSAPLFGYNAAKQVLYGKKGKPQLENDKLKLDEWSIASDEHAERLFLDNAYDAITEGSYVAIYKPPVTGSDSQGPDDLTAELLAEEFEFFPFASSVTSAEFLPIEFDTAASGNLTSNPETPTTSLIVYKVTATLTSPRTQYGLSGKTTRLTLDDNWRNPDSGGKNAFSAAIRGTLVYAQSEELSLATLPILDVVEGTTIALDSFYLGLQAGQKVILTGELADLEGVTHSELITLKDVVIQSGYTQITLLKGLAHRYIRNTVNINANVAAATHGETVQEVLGSGNASQPYQTFTLRQPPLTYISSDLTPSGALSTLKVRVNDVLWHEAPMLYGQKPTDRIYVTRREDNGTTIVEFGEGKTGSRLPTGPNNVEATYRKGIGLAGNVRANQLTSLMTRPLGVKDVVNPLPATGGDDPETLDRARQNAPLTVLTLERVVSLQDYEDFSRAFAGIAKALATWTWMGQARGVFITVAGPNGVAVESELIEKLVSQIQKSGDPHVPLQVKSYRQAFFRINARIKINPDFQMNSVLAAVKQALTDAFSFEARAFGQGVALSEVVAVIHAVLGVVAVDVDSLIRTDGIGPEGTQSPLPAAAPQSGGTGILAGELLLLDLSSLNNLGVMA